MKIIWQSVAPWVKSGYGVQTYYVTQILKRLGHKVIISAYYGFKGSPIVYKGIKVFSSSNWGAGLTPYYYQKFGTELLISHQDLWPLPEDYGLVINNWHPYLPIDSEPPALGDLSRLKYAKKPIVQSLFALKQLRKLNIDAYYVPAGVDTKIFKPGPKLKDFGDNFVVGLVGTNIGPRKNIQEAMQAFAKFHSRHKDTVFCLHTNVEDVDSGASLGALAQELGILDSVFFPPQAEYAIGISAKELAKVFNSFDVFLLPAGGEGFGVPIVEAEACQIPVIVSNFSAMPELVGGGWILKDLQKVWNFHNAWWVKPNLDEIVEYLEQAYQMTKDGSIVELKRKAREKALQYNFDALAPMWDAVLKDIELQPKGKCMEGVQPQRLMLIPKEVEPKRVLDIGCGLTKPYKPYLVKLGEYVGVDIKGGDGFVKADACNLPFGNQEFGYIWMSETLEHVKDAQKAVDEAKRVGVHGAITFSTPANPSFKFDDDHKEVKLKEKYLVNQEGNGIILW